MINKNHFLGFTETWQFWWNRNPLWTETKTETRILGNFCPFFQFFQVFRVSRIVNPFLQVFTRSDHKRYFPRWNVEESGAGYYWDMYIVRFATFGSSHTVLVEHFFWAAQCPGCPGYVAPLLIFRIFHALKYQAFIAQW